MNLTEALPTFVITLREGVEAALVVGIVLACLKKAEKSHLNSWVHAGIALGILVSGLIGVLFNRLIVEVTTSEHPYAPVIGELLKASLGVFAIGMLSWMLIWMTQQAKSLKSEVEGSVTTTLNQAHSSGALTETGAGWGVFSLILIAVLREGFETVVFILAQFQLGLMPVLGALGGLAGAAIFGVLLFKLGVKINLRLFFQVMGVFLLLIVAGLVITALKHLDLAGAILSQINPNLSGICHPESGSCFLGFLLWDSSQVLSDQEFPGILLKSLLGYRDHLYLVQGISYVMFLTVVGGLYWQSLGVAKDHR